MGGRGGPGICDIRQLKEGIWAISVAKEKEDGERADRKWEMARRQGSEGVKSEREREKHVGQEK